MTQHKGISEIGRRLLNNEDAAIERYAIFQGIDTDVLLEIVTGKVDPTELVRIELASRGLGKDGKWIGFPQARQLWGGRLMSRHIDERAYRMTVEDFKARFTFPLTPEQQALLDRAEGLGLKLDVVIGYACGRRYLMDLDAVED